MEPIEFLKTLPENFFREFVNMHEYFIVQNLFKVVENLLKQHPRKKIVKAVLLIGKYSGVEPELLKTALEFFKRDSPLKEAEIILEITELKLKCKDCEIEFNKDKWDVLCPRCGSFNTQIISGEELLLKSLELVDVEKV